MAEALEFHYKFTFADGRVKEFTIALDPKTLQLLDPPKPPFPAWTALKHHQCAECPLQETEFPQCPVAANVSELVTFAEQMESYEEAEIEITVPQRTYRKKTAVQYGFSSLMGIYMTTSGCPILDKMRPMVKTHLPFAKAEEVAYRTVSMYLLAQFFRMKEGKTPDWELKGLLDLEKQVQGVNQSFWKRISATSLNFKDGGVNALSHLDTLAKLSSYHIEDKELEILKNLFGSYLK
jgi:hypothetical protein